jgi:hypothetical protein
MISKVIDHALDDCLEDRKLCMTFVYVYRTFRDNENEPSWGTEAAINSGQVVLHTDLVQLDLALRHMEFQTQLE